MRFENATATASSQKAVLVNHIDFGELWVPRKAISVLSAMSPFAQARWGAPLRADLVLEAWFMATPQMQRALEMRRLRLEAAGRRAAQQAPVAVQVAAPPIVLSSDQEAEVSKVLAALEGPRPKHGPLVLVLNGPAGSGKTTVARELARRALAARLVGSVIYGAPTGRAALRLREAGCAGARTIHSLFFRSITEDEATGEADFAEPASPGTGAYMLIIDESSMVGKRAALEGEAELHDMMIAAMPAGSILLYLGDREQLEPVKGIWGPDFDNPTGTLETIHRQAAGSPVLQVATALRTTGRWPRPNPTGTDGHSAAYVHPATEIDLVEWYTQRREAGADCAMIAFTHVQRHALNALVRARLGHTEQGSLVPGDRLLVRRNAHGMGIMNGQVLNVVAVERFEGLNALQAGLADMLPRATRRGMTLDDDGGEEDGEETVGDPLLDTTYLKVRVAEQPHPDWWLIVPEHLLAADEKRWWAWRKEAKAAKMPREADYGEGEFDDFLRDLIRWKWANIVIDRAVPVNYGECLTGHAAQGSQWASVGVAVCGALRAAKAREPDFFRRWLYTAVTRASRELCVFNLKEIGGDAA